MNRLPIRVLASFISSLSLSPKGFAHTDMKLVDIVRMSGWMQSTCTAHAIGYLNSSNAQRMLKVSLSQIKKNHSAGAANEVRKQTFEKYPSCMKLMPLD